MQIRYKPMIDLGFTREKGYADSCPMFVRSSETYEQMLTESTFSAFKVIYVPFWGHCLQHITGSDYVIMIDINEENVVQLITYPNEVLKTLAAKWIEEC